MDRARRPTTAALGASEADRCGDLLDLLPTPAPACTGPGPWVAVCVDAQHPTLTGRVECEIVSQTGEPIRLWAPALHGVAIRAGDRLLLTKPENSIEPVVVGVLDGFARRPEPRAAVAAALALQRDERLLVTGRDGVPLLEFREDESGPVARLLHEDVELELAGALRLSAKSIRLAAREGEARVEAASDVVLVGETIKLN